MKKKNSIFLTKKKCLLKFGWQFYKLSVSPSVNLKKKIGRFSLFTNCLKFSDNLQIAWYDKLTLTYICFQCIREFLQWLLISEQNSSCAQIEEEKKRILNTRRMQIIMRRCKPLFDAASLNFRQKYYTLQNLSDLYDYFEIQVSHFKRYFSLLTDLNCQAII